MTTSAAERVFGVAELLEIVLASLPLKDILLVQRVSKDFRNSVKSSKRLQEALFLKPAKLCGVNAASEAGCARESGAQVDVTAAGASNKWLVLQKKLHHRRIHPVPLNPLLWQRTRINKSSFDTVDSLPIESIKFLHPAIGGLSLDRHSSTDGQVHLNVILEAKTPLRCSHHRTRGLRSVVAPDAREAVPMYDNCPWTTH